MPNEAHPQTQHLPNQLVARFPVTVTAADLLASTTSEGDPPEPIDFAPVPRRRNRRGGWSEQTQRDFIACLQRTGSVAASARVVGMTPSTAYRLLTVEGAESFAWDKAFEKGLGRLREDSLDRALNGALVPVYARDGWSASSIAAATVSRSPCSATATATATSTGTAKARYAVTSSRWN